MAKVDYKKIKTYNDACMVLGVKAENIEAVRNQFGRATAAFIQLKTICRALNGDWRPKFDNSEWRYYPWFIIYTKEEIAAMSEAEIKHKGIVTLPAGVGNANRGSNVGGSVLSSNYAVSLASPSFGGALASRTREIALYFGKAFHEIWNEYIFMVD